MSVNQEKLAHEVLDIIQIGVHRAFEYDADTSIDESELTPEVGDELILGGETRTEGGRLVRFFVRVYIGPDDIEVEDWEDY